MGNGSVTSGHSAAGREDDLRQRLAAVYDACAAALFRYAVMLLADPTAAEDVLQQVFVKLARRGRLEDIEAVSSYLRRAVRNECYGALRRRSHARHVAHARALLAAAPDPGWADPHEDLRAALEEALKALAPAQREVVYMKVYEKMTFRQIAAATGVAVNTAASRYRYALTHLRRLLGRGVRDER